MNDLSLQTRKLRPQILRHVPTASRPARHESPYSVTLSHDKNMSTPLGKPKMIHNHHCELHLHAWELFGNTHSVGPTPSHKLTEQQCLGSSWHSRESTPT